MDRHIQCQGGTENHIVMLPPMERAIEALYALIERDRIAAETLAEGVFQREVNVAVGTIRRASTILRQRSDQFKQPTSPSFQAG